MTLSELIKHLEDQKAILDKGGDTLVATASRVDVAAFVTHPVAYVQYIDGALCLVEGEYD